MRLLADTPRPALACLVCLSPPLDPPRGLHTVCPVHHSILSSSTHPSLPPASNRSRQSSSLIRLLHVFSAPFSLLPVPEARIFNPSPHDSTLPDFFSQQTGQSPPYLNTRRLLQQLPAPARLLRPSNRGHHCEETLPCHTAPKVKLLLHCKLHPPQAGLLEIWTVGN